MAVRTATPTAVLLGLGARWVIEVEVLDDDGWLTSDEVPTVVVTLPGGTTAEPEFEHVSTGSFRATYPVGAAGRFVAVVTVTGHGTAYFAAYVTGVTTAAGMPTTDDVADYLRGSAASWTTDDLQDALNAEAAAQRSVCRVGAIYPDDLRQALLRRVQRNLAMRKLPLPVPQGDADLGRPILPGHDPEVRRLEAPHRKLVMG